MCTSHDSAKPKLPKSQCEVLIRKFSATPRDLYQDIPLKFPRVRRSLKQFPTGSQYKGTWDLLGMSGYGVYTFPNGAKYEGEFDDGMFNGRGQLRYPDGVIIRGEWKGGQIINKKLIFGDGLEYNDTDWNYCQNDRRFSIEYREGVQPSGRSYFTAEQPTRAVPPGYYDTGDGLYNPKTKMICRSDDLTAVIRYPSKQEQKWIIENCPTSSETSIGPCLDLYKKRSENSVKPDLSISHSFASTEVLTKTDDLTPIPSPLNSSRNSTVRWRIC